MKRILRNPLQTFLAGLLALLPLVLTIAAVVWAGKLVHTLVGPGSSTGRLLVSIGLAVVTDEVAAYAIGFLAVILWIFGFGAMVQSGMKSRVQSVGDRMFRKVPFLGSLYDVAGRFISIFERQEGKELKNMSPVWCFLGGRGGTAVLALLPTDEPLILDGNPYLAILIPTAPVPFGGGLLFVPAEWVEPAAFGVEAFTSIYVSMGVTAPHLGRVGRKESPVGGVAPMD